jgi:hypothetical protein
MRGAGLQQLVHGAEHLFVARKIAMHFVQK